VSSQTGMPISIGRMSGAVTGPMLLRYYAALAQQAPAEESRPPLVGGTTVVRREPVGVVAAIVPAGRDVGGYLVRHPLDFAVKRNLESLIGRNLSVIRLIQVEGRAREALPGTEARSYRGRYRTNSV
jgi:hypothetical protein